MDRYLADLNNLLGELETDRLAYRLIPLLSGRKSQVISVSAKREGHGSLHQIYLGEFKWSATWEEYLFWPGPKSVFDSETLDRVKFACEALTMFHKENSDEE